MRFEVRDGVPGNYAIRDEVLREVEAKRRIIDDLAQVAAAVDAMERGEAQNVDQLVHPQAAWAALRTLRNMALPYADLAGYREEWRPV